MSDNKELHLLENYLSDNDITIFNYVDKLHEYNNFQILKETLDDRFYSLYTKKISKSKMNDNSYNFAATNSNCRLCGLVYYIKYGSK